MEWSAFTMKMDTRMADFVYHDYFNFNLTAKSLLNLAGILSNCERNRFMSQPLPKFDTTAPAPAGLPAKPRNSGPRPLAVTGVTTRPSPVHGLQTDVERAFAASANAANDRRIPFAITLAGVSLFSLTCWTLLFFLVKAL
jgi:hypothetical protein